MTDTKRKLPHLGKHWRILQQTTQIAIDKETHALLAAYAAKRHYTLREAGNRAIVAGLAVELAKEDAK
jgi:hypothetical protein